MDRGLPAALGQVLDGVVTVPVVDQIGPVEVQPEAAPTLADLSAPFGDAAGDIRDVAGTQSASAETERGDVVEQPILGVRRQIAQQSLGDPGCWPLGIKPVVPQGLWPVIAQVDGHRPAVGGRSRTQIGERAGLELDDPGLVDFINDGVWWPWQPVRARVEPGGQDDGLTYTRRRGVAEELVEEASAHRHSLG